jgi:hypothetical protein
MQGAHPVILITVLCTGSTVPSTYGLSDRACFLRRISGGILVKLRSTTAALISPLAVLVPLGPFRAPRDRYAIYGDGFDSTCHSHLFLGRRHRDPVWGPEGPVSRDGHMLHGVLSCNSTPVGAAPI